MNAVFVHHWSHPFACPPLLDWEELEQLLLDLAVGPTNRELVSPSLRAVAKQARLKPPLLVWRELAVLIWIVLDETPLVIEPEPSDGEAPMP